MSLAIVHSRAQVGVEAPCVSVEAHLANGLPSLTLVGLPETAVRESKDRVRSALLNAGFDFPARRITLNLAPADLPKDGGRFDLAIALGILAASGQLPGTTLDGLECLGELALSGAIRPVRGQHFGAGRLLEARRAGRVGIGFGALCMLLFAGLFWWMPEAIIGLFLDRDAPANREVAAMAVSLLAIAAWFELFDGTQNVAMGAIRGLKDARTTFLVGLACYWLVGVPLACLLAFAAGWGAAGVWWGLAGGLACAAIGLTLAFEWKTARLLPKATASETSALNCRAAGRGAPSARRCPGNAPVPPAAAAD